MAFAITEGNVDDRKPVPEMAKGLFGRLFGDRGYVSQSLSEKLYAQGLELIARRRKNMKNSLLQLMDKTLLRKRAIRLLNRSMTSSKTFARLSILGIAVGSTF